MKLTERNPRQSLNKAFLKIKPGRSEIESFKTNLVLLLDKISVIENRPKDESEEHLKNDLRDFLRDTYYRDINAINTKDKNDLVIHLGKTTDSEVGVIIEAKRPSNKSEMMTQNNINVKAFHELILYYLRERITQKNLQIKYLIATNIYEWFIFDAQIFDKLFAQNKIFVEQFQNIQSRRLSDNRTAAFYEEIAKPFVNKIEAEIAFTWFDIREFVKPLRNADRRDDNSLIALYKLLSPEHLLKLPFTNDSNSLDKTFYTELLHIIGLEETKDGGKKLIGRKAAGSRQQASLMESAIIQLDSMDRISRLEKPQRYGETNSERLFNLALELSITWINRLLFLKLLEAQLIKYHKGDKSFAFLNIEKIPNFDELNSLFFQVLARKPEERSEQVKKMFANVPYLNSSLFEPTDSEHNGLFISMLKDAPLPVLNSTVLKDQAGRKQTAQRDTLEYLFEFLDAYDFADDGAEEVREDKKTLINASVLGLIFEKINGYKDGSVFTPGFITMYMSREAIRRAVVQKFNAKYNWKAANIGELKNYLADRNSSQEKLEFNAVINALRICDPAVGSGHFLVSALNEIILIKHELGLLVDDQGARLSDYEVTLENDELIVTDENGKIFEYHPKHKESRHIQETLFREKQTIIENCLFGVDINPNSVNICRLRLWIELLKNAYYKAPDFTELETLPNIDINIKCGNSLISRYPLDADIKNALRNSKWKIDGYRVAVMAYRNARNKDDKKAMEKLIAEIKSNFESEVAAGDKRVVRLKNLKDELKTHATQTHIFGLSKAEKAAWEARLKKLTAEIKKLETAIEEIKSNKIYENAFEWRFEFPEVLNDEGDFIGFDVVIGNPPYLTGSAFKEYHDYFGVNFTTAEYQLDLYTLFIELTNGILAPRGVISLITPNSWLKNLRMTKTRKFVLDKFDIKKLNPNIAKAFEEASVDTLIFIATQAKSEKNIIEIVDFNSTQNSFTKNSILQKRFYGNENFVFDVEVDESVLPILKKIRGNSFILEDNFEITRGVNPYDKYRGQSEEVIKTRAYHSSSKKDDTFVPELKGKHVATFKYTWDNKHFISYGSWLAAPRDPKFFKGERLIFREIIGERFVCAIIEEAFIIDRSLYIALPKNEEVDVYFVLGVLCSKLLVWLFKYEKNEFDDLFPKIRLEEFKKLPIPKRNNDNEISQLAKQITKLKNRNADCSTEEFQIDQLVYQLYNLTPEEIAIVEGVQ